jgi:ubiquinone/menaquinone biosynthesis C-methylase UbiE
LDTGDVRADSIADTARERNRRVFDGAFGSVYGAYIRRERLARLIARLVWGSDTRPFYASMAAIGQVADGGTIVDAPCGSGVAFRAIRPAQPVRYLGFDLSPRMLEQARRYADRLGLHEVELAQADAETLPLEDASADLFLSYFGLHCFPHPDAAVREAARCLRVDGRMVGSTIVLGDRRLDRLRVRPGAGAFGPVGTEADLERWLSDAGVTDVKIDRSGVFAVFSGSKQGR